MLETYEEAIDWIHTRLRLGIKPGLKRMDWMMDRLGSPEKKLKTIHIGGTNGKGSTVTYLRTILQEAGWKVGTFTSPYFEHFNERIAINGDPICEEELIHLTNKIKMLSDELEGTELGGPTEFEVITAMSLYYFASVHPVDIVLYEVGLGGRFDSTNVITPKLSIITSIGLDHTNILGDTYEKIAFEKAGIIKREVPILTAVKQEEAFKVIKDTAVENQSPLYRLRQNIYIEEHTSLPKGERFSLRSPFGMVKELEISMFGGHQTENAALAITAAQMLGIDTESIKKGLKKAYWPGRFELVSTDPTIIMDGAHNEEGMDALVQELSRRYFDKKIKMVFAALGDKRLDGMIGKMDAIADEITFVEFEFPRAEKAEILLSKSKHSRKKAVTDWKDAIQSEIRSLKDGEILVVTGSLYFLSEVKPFIEGMIKR